MDERNVLSSATSRSTPRQRTGVYRGSAGEDSPNSKSSKLKARKENWLNTKLPLCMYFLIYTLIPFLFGLIGIWANGWDTEIADLALLTGSSFDETASNTNVLFLIMLLIIVSSAIRLGYIIYQEYWYGDGFLNYLKRRRLGC